MKLLAVLAAFSLARVDRSHRHTTTRFQKNQALAEGRPAEAVACSMQPALMPALSAECRRLRVGCPEHRSVWALGLPQDRLEDVYRIARRGMLRAKAVMQLRARLALCLQVF